MGPWQNDVVLDIVPWFPNPFVVAQSSQRGTEVLHSASANLACLLPTIPGDPG